MDAYLLIACVLGAILFAGIMTVWETTPTTPTGGDESDSHSD